MKIVRRLSDEEWSSISEVNRLLTSLTVDHSHNCECGLCRARMETDVQNQRFRQISYEPEEVVANKLLDGEVCFNSLELAKDAIESLGYDTILRLNSRRGEVEGRIVCRDGTGWSEVGRDGHLLG